MLILFALLISNITIAQCDTNYLYLDYLEISFEDSTEYLVTLKLENGSDTLKFTDLSDVKMIGISRAKECKMTLTTNKSEIILENINEYLSFIETKYCILINMPKNHSVCVEATYFQPDGWILIHSQKTGERKKYFERNT